MGKVIKALNYDLDDLLLQKHYPNPKNYKNAWRDVKSFLCKNGFEPRQYSGVISTKPMSYYDVSVVFKKLLNYYKWLEPCIQKFDVTNVGKQISLIDMYRDDKNILKNIDINLDIESILNNANDLVKDEESLDFSLSDKSKGRDK